MERDEAHLLSTYPFRFIDLFAGVGGFRIGLEALGGECVFSSEWNSYSQTTYEKWFGEKPIGDINTISYADIPDHDILCGGFPCQPFSLAGVSKKNSLGRLHGFDCEEQGNLFFNICDITKAKRPPILILENVKNLLSHEKGRTWEIIQETLNDIDYDVKYDVVDASHWVPQHRERVFIVCFDRTQFRNNEPYYYHFPDVFPDTIKTLDDILEKEPDQKHVLSAKLWNYLKAYKEKHAAQGSGFGYGLIEDPKTEITRTLSARYHKDGAEILISRGGRKNPRRLTVVEASRLMGFSSKVNTREDIPVSDAQAYRQFGNAVVPAVVTAVAKPCLPILKSLHEKNLQEA